MDLTGSGVETTSHMHEPGNGRICVMFIAFEGPPRIVRIWGKGRVLENGEESFQVCHFRSPLKIDETLSGEAQERKRFHIALPILYCLLSLIVFFRRSSRNRKSG
jgi:hypothetical protein